MVKHLLILAALVCVPAHATGPDRAATEAIIHDYLLAHPEIIPEAMDVLEARKQAKVIAAHRKAIETPFGYAWQGNPEGDVTLVEFFDYNCGYCRASVADVARLLKEDPRLRVVYRELPVLGAESDTAATVSLAIARTSPNWHLFHLAAYEIFETDDKRLDVAAGYAKIKRPTAAAAKAADLRAEINANLEFAQEVRITGTPSWVIGDKLLSGAIGFDALKAAIAAERAAKAH
jgi:protein-disulfide isomerase